MDYSIKRPELPEIDEFDATVLDIAEMEAAIAALRVRLNKLPLQIATKLSGDEERLIAARYLYWTTQEMHSSAICRENKDIPLLAKYTSTF
ncbi:MAG: hypothetical protein IID32_07870 [Planctomycetes bacterium]|nr:hypothetical protein [Planctomycetota bacterium]